jgi:hypothetical protein
MSEAEFADWQRSQGKKPFFHAGHHWEMDRGFCAPTPVLTRVGADQAVAPDRPHWGFRAVLRDDATSAATGTLPVHLLRDVANYDSSGFSSNRRKQLRKCHNRVQFAVVDEPSLLQSQGYRVVRSALERTGHLALPREDSFLAGLPAYTAASHRLTIAGLVGDQLGGYISGYAVEGTAYFEDLFVATEALTTNITLGLVYEFVQECRRSGAVHEVVNGLHAREDAALDTFKEAIGFPVVHLPTRVHLNAWARRLLRYRYPDKLYRLEGLAG